MLKLKHAFFLGAVSLLLTGCKESDLRDISPVGRIQSQRSGSNLPQDKSPTGFVNEHAIRRQRRMAETGRPIAPGDNASPLLEKNSLWPAWLEEAFKYDKLYAGHSTDFQHLERPVISGDPGFNEFGENKLLIRMWDFALAGHKLQRSLRVYNANASWGGVFAHWCLTHSSDPDTDKTYQSVSENPADGINWLKYGDIVEPQFGAIMIVEREGRFHVSFCVGAFLPNSPDANGELKRIYLGYGGDHSGQVGVEAFTSDQIRGFRWPPGCQSRNGLLRLDESPWVRQYQELYLGNLYQPGHI